MIQTHNDAARKKKNNQISGRSRHCHNDKTMQEKANRRPGRRQIVTAWWVGIWGEKRDNYECSKSCSSRRRLQLWKNFAWTPTP